ncbi:E3 SUMO-protein ligase PIAS2 [Grus japonensis]|uniref:E3 SUMO-protein ligase PIAS2 n=1 Tax=Grus japonensis TaxID=30415 RepID=A0ABC9YGS0_GRUJA
MNEKKPTWICPVCDKKAAYESLILDGLFMEILNECSDVDEIKFQEDGSWCPMRPKKEAVKVSSPQCSKIESSSVVGKQCSVMVANEVNKKKVDVIDLTIESSSDEEEDPSAKRKCIFMSETQGSPTKGHKMGILEMFPYWLPMGGRRDLLLVFGLVHVVTLLHSSIFNVMTLFMSQFGQVRSGFSFTNPS